MDRLEASRSMPSVLLGSVEFTKLMEARVKDVDKGDVALKGNW